MRTTSISIFRAYTRILPTLFVLTSLLARSLVGQGQDSSLLPTSDPFLVSLGSQAEPLPLSGLLDAALTVSGTTTEALPARRIALAAIVHGTSQAAKVGDTDSARAETALKLLYERGILRGYSSNATTLLDIMDRGAYNCVSSAVLYLLILKDLDIACVGIKTSDHAFCLVRADGRDIDVETTNHYGFDPGTKKEFTDAFGTATGYSYVPPGSYRKREIIGERQLLSLILSNRSAILEERRRYPEALALGVSYAALRGDAEGRGFLIDRINNVATDFATKKNWQAMRDLVAAGRARLGDDPRLLALAGEAADSALTQAIGTKPFAEALALVKASAAAGEISVTRTREYLVYLYGSQANKIGRSGDWLAAAALADEGAATAGGDRNLTNAAANFRRNFVVETHNRFASFYNARRFAEAKVAIEEGLRLLPGEASLLADLKAANSALAGR